MIKTNTERMSGSECSRLDLVRYGPTIVYSPRKVGIWQTQQQQQQQQEGFIRICDAINNSSQIT